jgi:NAD(P)H-hydrate epimerase
MAPSYSKMTARRVAGLAAIRCARRLSIWGADVSVILAAPVADFQGVPLQQLEIVGRLPILVHQAPFDGVAATLRSADLVLHALIGYSLRGAPREPIATLIRAANASGTPLLALDLPSGLNGDSGEASDPTIRATATLTLALPKAGLTRPTAAAWVGELYVADISVACTPPPEAVYRRMGMNVGPIFWQSDVITLGSA